MARILVVDDEPEVLLVLEVVLQKAGHDVLSAQDGAEAEALARRDSPDLIMLDLMMPGRDGFDVLASLKQDETTRSIPVIMVTARDQPMDIQRARQQGAIDYISKPWSEGEVELRVEWALDGRAAAPAKSAA